MLVATIKNRPIDSNCYVLYTEESRDCIVLDPGTEDCAELLEFLNNTELNPIYIILTHEHFDHVWGVNKLFNIFTPVLICSKKCLEAIVNKKKNLSLFFDNSGFDVVVNRPWFFADEIAFNQNISIKIIHTPGHSSGSIAIWINNYLFTGDTILMNSKIVTKLPGGSKLQLNQSLSKLLDMFRNKNVKIYPGHGDSFSFDDFKFDDKND